MVCVTEHPLEDQSRFIQSCLIQPSRAGERYNEPEGANVERSLGAFKPIVHFFHVVAIDQTVGDQPTHLGRLINRIKSLQHSGVRRRKEEYQRHHQIRGVQRFTPVMLDKRLTRGTPSLDHNLLIDLVADLQPLLPVGRERPFISQSQATIKRDPAHELGIDEVLWSSASFPDTLVFTLPVIAYPVDQPSEV